jgi:HlyD family secretion protein
LQGDARGEGKGPAQGGRVLLLQDGRLVERPVKTGLSNWEHTEIVDGLQGGERIVTSLDRAGVKAGAAAAEDAAPQK